MVRVQLQIGVGCWRSVGQHDVKAVQRQLRHQVIGVVLKALQAQCRHLQDRREQAVHQQLGQSVSQAHGQTQRGFLVGLAKHRMKALPELEDLVRLRQRDASGFGQGQAPPFGLEQGHAQFALQLPHLRADGLHGHAQSLGGPGHPAFGGNHPEVVKVSVIHQIKPE